MTPNLPPLNPERLRQTRNDFVKEATSFSENEVLEKIAGNPLFPSMSCENLNIQELTEEETEIAKSLIENHLTPQSPQISTRDFLLLSTYLPHYIIPIFPVLDYVPDTLILGVLENLLQPIAAFIAQEDLEQKANLLSIAHNYVAKRIETDPHSEITDKCADLVLKATNTYSCLYLPDDALRNFTEDRSKVFHFILDKYNLISHYTPTGENPKIGILTSHVGNDDGTLYALQLLKDFKAQGIPTIFICDSGASISIQKEAESLASQTLPLAKGIKDAIQQIQNQNLEFLIFTDPLYDSEHPTFLIATQQLAKTQIALQNTLVTTGFNTIQHILIDKELKSSDSHFIESMHEVENLNTALLNSVKYEEPMEAPTREEINVDPSTTLYVSAVPMHFITPQVRETWISILKNKKDSKLLLLPYQNERITEEDKKLFSGFFELEAEAQGVPESNLLILTDPISTIQILDNYISLGDIYLDSFPNNSPYAAARALSLKLPVITLQGENLREIMTSKILLSSGAKNPISSNPEEYISHAISIEKETQTEFTISELETTTPAVISSMQSTN